MNLSRRQLLRAVGLSAVAAPVLSACAGPGRGLVVTNDPTRIPHRGGTLRIAVGGGGAAETLDPFGGTAPADLMRTNVVFDQLFMLDRGKPVPALATAVTPASDGRSAVLELRPGVTWHDGTPFTAADVVYSFNYMSSPNLASPSQLSSFFDVPGVRALGPSQVLLPARVPIGDPALMLAAFPAQMVKAGQRPGEGRTAIGTGPLQLVAFEPGRETRLRRFDGYYARPAAVDELVLTSLTDTQARVNAVITDQADFTNDLPASIARAGVQSPFEVRTEGPGYRTGFGFMLNMSMPPFNDPRVRMAARLAVDRQALVDTVLLGYGTVGNDLLGAGSPYYDDRQPVAFDPDRARALIREAGAVNAPVRIRSSEYVVGFNDSTKLFAEQLRQIGLDAQAQIVGQAEFYEPSALASTSALAYCNDTLPLAVIYGRLSAMPTLAMDDEEFRQALATALGSTREETRAAAWGQLQAVMADRGNTIVWGQADILSLARSTVAGIEPGNQPRYPYLAHGGFA